MLSVGAHGTTRLVGAAVAEKKTHRTFGEPLEAVPRDPAKFLKRGSSVRKGPGKYKSADANGSPFKYADDRCEMVITSTRLPALSYQFNTSGAV